MLLNKHLFKPFCLIITTLILVSSCGGSSDKESITPINLSPEANAGVDQTIDEQSEVILSGSGSDSDGNITSYQWVQTAGINVELKDSDKATASFTAPDINQDETLTFQLTVTDNDEATASDDVFVYIAKINQVPIANAGEGATVFIADNITLNCSGSMDPDEDKLTYHWQQTKGATVTLSDDSICQPIFKVPNEEGQYDFTLKVSDGFDAESFDTVTYHVNAYQGNVNEWQTNVLSLIGNLPINASEILAFQENLLFISLTSSGWAIVDISTPTAPTLLVTQDSISTVYDISVSGNYAFIADHEGISAFNISAPKSPAKLSLIDTQQLVTTVEIKGDFLYAVTPNTNGNDALIVADISDILSPKIIASLEVRVITALTIKGNYIYLATHEGLKVVDISSPQSPELVSTLATGYYSYAITVYEDKAYLSTREKSLVIVDISDPIAPRLVSTFNTYAYNTPDSASEVHVVGNQVYLATYGALKIVDVSTPTEPSFYGSLPMHTRSVHIQNNLAYITYNGITTIDLSTVAKLEIKNQLRDKAKIGINIKDDKLFATSIDLFEIIDIANGADYSTIGEFLFSPFEGEDNFIDSWALNKVNAYLSTTFLGKDEISLYHTIQIVDVTEPSSPQLLGTLDTNSYGVDDIVIKDNNMYIVGEDVNSETIDFKIFDISDPISPTLLGAIPSIAPGHIYHTPKDNIFIDQELAFISNSSFITSSPLRIVDISNTSSPTLLSTTKELSGKVTVIKNNILYLADGGNGIKVIDIAEPTEPKLITSLDTWGYVNYISLDANKLYVSEGSLGLKIYDNTTVEQPLLERKIFTGGYTSQSIIKDGNIFLADTGGLLTLDIEQLSTNALINSDQSYTLVNKSSNLNYSVNWSTDDSINIKCLVTRGSCSSIINKQNKTAEVEWITPDIDGDYEIVILGGNTSSQQVIRDRITVY